MTQRNLSNEEARALMGGTRVEVRRGGMWTTATVIAHERAVARSSPSADRYALTQLDDRRLGWAWGGERGFWWADEGIRLMEQPTESETTMENVRLGRHEFPAQPRVLSYWDVHRRDVPVSGRWVRLPVNGNSLDIFYMGDCLNCGISTWVCADGTVIDAIGNWAYYPAKKDGKTFRLCRGCALNESIVNQVVEQRKDDDSTGPLVWPDVLSGFNEPVRVGALRVSDDLSELLVEEEPF